MPAEPVKALPIELDRGVALDEAIHAIVSNTLEHFVANWGALRERDDADAVHQLRVALRRLRSALKMFATVLPKSDCESLREDARRIASGLAPARDCDVFRASVEQGPAAERPDLCVGLLAAVEERRQSAYLRARTLIEESAATMFVLKTQSFLAGPAWRSAASGIATKHFARKALNKLHRRALKRGKGLPAIPDKERHQLRIALKTLRYAIEFMGSVFGRRAARMDYAGVVSELQDLLGTHNDEVTVRRLLTAPPFRDAPATNFLLGWYSLGATAADKRLAKSWKKFRRAEPFWT